MFEEKVVPKDFCLCLPSRGRPEELRRLLKSICVTTRRINAITVVVGLDYDDEKIPDYFRIIKFFNDTEGLGILTMIQRRSPNLTKDYINRGFAAVDSKYLFVLNDDAELLTVGWDDLVRQQDDHGFIYFDTVDTTRNFENVGEFACFPIITRRVFNALGYFYHPKIYTWGADKFLHLVCEKAGIIRKVPVNIKHHRLCNDEQHENMRTQMNLFGSGGSLDYTEDILRLKKEISK